MRKNIFVFMILGTCVSLPAFADYTIGNFVAPKGADGINGTNGTDCRPTETRTRCFGTGNSKCGDTTRSGVKIVTTQCDGSDSTTSYIYDNNCGITVASTTDVHQDNDSNKPITHKRVTFKNTCTNETLSTTADVPAGCTPAYTTKYINKAANGSLTYNNDSRGESTIGARVTVSGCGNDNSFDTYDGNDGTSFNYKGSVANCNALNSVSNPAQNDAYIVNGDGNGKLCIYNGSSWPTCPSGCAEFTGPAGASNCTGFETSTTAVKNTLRTYSGPSNSTTNDGVTFYATRGKMVLTHKMCNTSLSDTVDNENDPCVPIIAPSGVTCNGTYMECKRGDDSSLYNVCEATTGTTFSSALSNKEDAVCVGTNANSSSVERKKTVSYTAPTGSGTVKTGVGKVVNKSVKCDNSETTISSTPDKCEEIAKPNGVCAENGKVYYKCTQQNDGTEYNLCAAGSSVLGAAQSAAQSAAETAVAAMDPCASVANGTNDEKKAQIKSMNSTYTLQTVSNGNDRTAVGYSTLTKTTCATGADATQVEYQYDTCKEIADTRTSGACSGNDKVYLECVNQTKGASDSGYTYKVCQTVTANTSLSGKITAAQTAATNAANAVNGKLDASALTIGSDGTLKYDDSCSTNIAGVTNVKKNGGAWYRKYAVYTTCPNDVTTNSKLRMWLNNFCSQNSDGNGTAYTWTNLPGADCYSDSITGSEAPYKFNLYVKIDSNDMVHPDSIGRVVGEQLDDMGIVDSATGKMSVNMLPASAVTTNNLATNLASSTDAVFNLGTDANPVEMTLSDVVELLHVITGNCTESTGTLNRTVECDNGAIGSRVQMTQQLGTSTAP